jgi:hypothetical protein
MNIVVLSRLNAHEKDYNIPTINLKNGLELALRHGTEINLTAIWDFQSLEGELLAVSSGEVG